MIIVEVMTMIIKYNEMTTRLALALYNANGGAVPLTCWRKADGSLVPLRYSPFDPEVVPGKKDFKRLNGMLSIYGVTCQRSDDNNRQKYQEYTHIWDIA